MSRIIRSQNHELIYPAFLLRSRNAARIPQSRSILGDKRPINVRTQLRRINRCFMRSTLTFPFLVLASGMFYLEISIRISVYSVACFISKLNPTIPFEACRYCVDIGPYQKRKAVIIALFALHMSATKCTLKWDK